MILLTLWLELISLVKIMGKIDRIGQMYRTEANTSNQVEIYSTSLRFVQFFKLKKSVH